MRGKLVLFALVLAVAAVLGGWEVSHNPQLFIGGPGNLAELKSVPRRGGFDISHEVRVCLTPAPVLRVQITVDQPYTVQQPGIPPRQPVRPDAPGTSVVSLTPSGFRFGGRDIPGTSLEITAEHSPAIWVEDHLYRGRVRLLRQGVNKLIVVNVLPLEDYVASVVDGEMPATFPEAARQSQAIVARTYVLYQIQTARVSPLFDVYATTRSQNYLGYQYRGRNGKRYAAESASSRRVVDATAGMVCLWDGKLFCTYYTAVCGGRTAGGSAVFGDPVPTLESVDCIGCRDAELYRWSEEIPVAEAADRLKRYLSARGWPLDGLASIRRIAEWQTVQEPVFEVNDGRSRYRLSALELRRLFSSAIHSYEFDVHMSQAQVIFDGQGHGHGVGLCQWGARGMARDGAGPLEILRHYYPGTDVVALE
jgi:stage II sporulation protein D